MAACAGKRSRWFHPAGSRPVTLTARLAISYAVFGGVIVLVLETAAQDPGRAIERLLERYRRLTPGRLYTITPNRVKIRQLPGAAQRKP